MLKKVYIISELMFYSEFFLVLLTRLKIIKVLYIYFNDTSFIQKLKSYGSLAKFKKTLYKYRILILLQ